MANASKDKMAVDIGKKYLDNLTEKRALVRQALQEHNVEELSRFVVKKDNLIISVEQTDSGTCYECCTSIKAGEGLKLNITERKNRDAENYYFHRYHF